jgi:hypothetical protein
MWVLTPRWPCCCPLIPCPNHVGALDREGYARYFIGERDGDKLEGLVLHEFLCPGSQRVVVRLAMIEDRMRAHDEQCPQISIAQLRDAAQSHLAAGRVPVVIPARFTEDVRADFRAQNRLDFRRIVRIGVVTGWPSQSRPLKGSPRDLRGLGSCERQIRRREPTEPEYVNPFHREVPKP